MLALLLSIEAVGGDARLSVVFSIEQFVARIAAPPLTLDKILSALLPSNC